MDSGNFVEFLPLEVTEKIFSKLDIRALLQATLVCKKWHQIIGNAQCMKNVALDFTFRARTRPHKVDMTHSHNMS